MKALIYTGACQVEMGEIAPPEASAGEAVVDIAYCGICGSDMHAWAGHDPRRVPPLVLGHEVAGIARDGKHKGKPVAINPLVTCGECEYCQSGRVHLCPDREMLGMRKHGGFTEAVAIAEGNLTPLPTTLPLATAALAEPLACAIHAVKLFPQASKTAPLVIIGGGAIGLLSALVAAHHGFTPIEVLDTNGGRRQAITDLGHDAITARDPTTSPPKPDSVAYVLDAVGSGITRGLASQLVAAGGCIVHIGLQDNINDTGNNKGLDTRRLTLHEITFIGSYCYTPSDFKEAVGLLGTGVIAAGGWVDIRPLARGAASFQDIHAGHAPPKIILANGGSE
ncbi:MAG: alcohol dehydrogenase catalytic domain-containing protein [Proteobacteria bacterium]|nr:alcohol dehydrogenase catalytic domain-containing protein [Pseudomonadota bacterium]